MDGRHITPIQATKSSEMSRISVPLVMEASQPLAEIIDGQGLTHDTVTDDTAAINYAISFGGRCGPGVCNSSTVSPATVYFPSGFVH